ncbi:hypothetical protein I8752_26235 [Nostocaceae cyanobacterium CENA369]|uniref:Uncharacterized protein n=1 Tax=Dendronalium phyllosphericum CENA369 TaxID=1725256 RepID=A0A8J7ICG1_9NOST|nr:hypothetical protein [Dendronalium phyllosphericum]MBH8576425.1 hypothetical protein [Dendronalium phyllosphericum CENA369]
MNYQPEEDLERRLQKLETEINSSSKEVERSQSPNNTSESSFTNLKSHLRRSQLWFNNLSGTSKIVFAGVAVLLGFALVQAVLKLVASAISLAVLALLVYVGYKFFVSGSFQNKQ